MTPHPAVTVNDQTPRCGICGGAHDAYGAKCPPEPDPRLWTEPFLLMSAPDDDPCTVPGCRTQSKTRWKVEVIGYQGHGKAPLTGPTFTACLSHLTQQMNRFLPMGGRRC